MSRDAQLLRHFIAAIIYRLEKAVRNAPPEYPTLSIGNGVRSPVEILSHITFVLTCAHSVFEHYERLEEQQAGSWEEEFERFHQIADKLDQAIAGGLPDRERIAEKLLQGPLSDAMTHVGQLAMLRRMANDPIPAESFFHAPIRIREDQG